MQTVPIVLLLVLVPLGFAAVALAIPSDRVRPFLLPVGALVHLVLAFVAVAHLDPEGNRAGRRFPGHPSSLDDAEAIGGGLRRRSDHHASRLRLDPDHVGRRS